MVDEAIILTIFSSVIVLVIYLLQKRTDSKMKSILTEINKLSSQQSVIINEEKERHDTTKNYFIHHTQGSLKLIKHQYETLQNFITDLTNNGSEEKSSIINMCKFNSEQFHSHTFLFVKDLLQIASNDLSPWIAHKFIDIFAGVERIFSDIKQNPSLLENNSELENICKSIEDQIQTINDLIDKINDEKPANSSRNSYID
jgi:hypothetical protein